MSENVFSLTSQAREPKAGSTSSCRSLRNRHFPVILYINALGQCVEARRVNSG